MDIEDIQVFEIDEGTSMVKASNAGKAHSYGAELDFAWRLTDQWTLDGALGLIQAEYDEYNAYSNNSIEKTPEYKMVTGIGYHNPNGFYGRLDFRLTGSTYFDAANTLQGDEYLTLDLKAGYRTGNWDFYAYVKNLNDETQIIDAIDYSYNIGTRVMYGDPRIISIGLRYSF